MSEHVLRRCAVGALIVVASVVSGQMVALGSQWQVDVGNAVDVADAAHTVDVVEQHQPPVEVAILDPFRAPPEPWLAGNRGIEYDTKPGDVVRASANGVVVFAGSVAGESHVTVRHSPTLVTTAAFVSEVLVSVGDVVGPGDPLAIAGGPIHFTARRNGVYIDPATLFSVVRHSVRLVANE